MGWLMLEVQEQCDGFSTKNEDIENLVGRQERMMSYGTCQHPLPVRAFFSWLPWPARPLLVSLTSPLCCSESEHSSDLNSRIYSSNSLCFLPVPSHISLKSDVLHTVVNSV